MNIMLWCGYQNPHWNKQTWLAKGIGGSEYCVLKLAENLAKLGHNVTVSGDVVEGTYSGVNYIHHNNLIRYRGPLGIGDVTKKVYDHYHVVIASNYINYFKHLDEAGITFDRSFFWIHNEYFYAWYKGSLLPDNGKQYLADKRLTKIVGVSKFHEPILDNYFKNTFNSIQLNLHSIDNAIDVNDWVDVPTKHYKIDGQIIWSSSPDRGLDLILDNWVEWKKQRPDLTLRICCPPYSKDWFKHDVSELKGVTWLGSLSPHKLRLEIARSEYWIYASEYTETYCISAVEMMMGKVKILTNGTGNIKHLINNNELGEKCNLNPDIIIQKLVKDRDDKVFAYRWLKKVDKARAWAEQQNWIERAKEWEDLCK